MWLGTPGGTDGVEAEDLPALGGLLAELVENGGQVWLCGRAPRPRGITEDQVVKSAQILGAAKAVEEVVAGAKTVAFA